MIYSYSESVLSPKRSFSGSWFWIDWFICSCSTSTETSSCGTWIWYAPVLQRLKKQEITFPELRQLPKLSLPPPKNQNDSEEDQNSQQWNSDNNCSIWCYFFAALPNFALSVMNHVGRTCLQNEISIKSLFHCWKKLPYMYLALVWWTSFIDATFLSELHFPIA